MKLKNFRMFAMALVLALGGASLLPGGSAEAGEAGQSETWGAETRVAAYDRFFIAGAPDEAALERAREAGVSVVISLQGELESDWDEAAAAEALGLEFHRFPVNGAAAELARDPFAAASAVVEANPDATILVHCASGNRASAWLALYLDEHAGMTVDEALATARETGLRGGLAEKVAVLLEENGEGRPDPE